ncbi:MAG: TolC family protein, partial [Pseudomonadota bacterium]
MAPAPETPNMVSDMPEAFAAASAEPTSGAYAPQKWWSAFEDPVLDGLVDRALASNLDIAESAARLRQVKAQARIAQSALVPTTTAGGNASSTSSPVDGLAFGNPVDRPTAQI